MGYSSALSSMDSTSNGLQILKQRKSDARMSRITDLLSVEATLSSANQKELDNLIICDTYDPKSFSESHRIFKSTHNNVFSALGMLVRTCSVICLFCRTHWGTYGNFMYKCPHFRLPSIQLCALTCPSCCQFFISVCLWSHISMSIFWRHVFIGAKFIFCFPLTITQHRDRNLIK